MKVINKELVNNKKILLRVDYNVDLDNKGKIISDFRIRASLSTINFLMANNAKKIIIISHLGKPKGKDNNLSLKPIAEHLSSLLKKEVVFIDDCIGDKVRKTIELNENKKIFLLENLRFYEGEEKNDESFAKELAKLADVYVNDAFGVCHRLNASVAAITKFLPSYAGLLLEKETNNLLRLKAKVERPFVVVLGGAKISTKLPVLKNFLEIADCILLGGGLANTVCQAWGFSVGKSLVEKEMLKEAKELGSGKAELILPGDFVVAFSFNDKKGMIREIGEVKDNEIIVDIGPIATKFFVNTIKNAKTILWNGPMGYFENKEFKKGTEKIAKAIAQNKNFTVIGGGETLVIAEDLKLLDKYSFVSTGGGAMLSFLSDENLPSLELLEE